GLDFLRRTVAASVRTHRYEPVPGATVIWDLAEARVFGPGSRHLSQQSSPGARAASASVPLTHHQGA
ncbi:MAG: hypothetical protein LKF98_05555, partial [Microbacteriaceae bacterium]|nr:hypothetical protein [Microbacteriaceae bacterium]